MQWSGPDDELMETVHDALKALQMAAEYVWADRPEDAREQLDEAERVIREFRQRHT